MRPLFKNIFGIIFLLIIVLAALGILFNNLTKKSFYDESGVVKVKGISNKVNIYKSELGVSHIFAENESDMYFSLGYIHAQDRLWQMDITRRVAQGKLSEILGKDVLDYDILFRTIGINKNSEELYKKLSLKSKSLLSDYCKGVNYFIQENSKQLPLEFDILNYKPEEWKPEHSLMILRLMGWELNLSWYTDLVFGEIVKKFGIEKARDFFPDYPEDAPFIVRSDAEKNSAGNSQKDIKGEIKKDVNGEIKKEIKNKTTGYNSSTEKNYIAASGLGKNYLELVKSFKTFYGTEGTHIGSNSWVVSGSRTESGKPLLANDPHLALQVPSKWYEVSMYDNLKKYSVCGFSIPGIPGIAIGHNNAISWGLTNLMNDDSDFMILKRDSADRKKYVYKNVVFALDSSFESIKIKDDPDNYEFTLYSTIHGPVISNLEKTGFLNNQKIKNENDELLTFKWTGYEFSDEIEAFYNVNNAKSFDEFQNGLKSYGTPAMNAVYADTAGNIGYHSIGLVPVRKNYSDEALTVYPASYTGEIEWSGFIPYEELPSEQNPKEGYIVTANNNPKKNYKYYISNLYEPPYRAERIEEMLTVNSIITEDEFKIIQRDVYSIQAKDFCKYLFEAFGDTLNLTNDIKTYLDLLKNWDYEFKTNSIPASLFAEFEVQLYKNLYKDALGEEDFENYIYIKNIPVRNTAKLLKQSSSALIENNFSKEQILRKSFYDAVSAMIARYGSDQIYWQWGDVHKVYMKHPLGIVPALSSMLNIGPFKIGGNGTTINNLEYSFSAALKTGEFESFLGPSMRMISDLSKVQEYLSIIPTGQSGQPLHPNYSDQARLWLNGDYKKVSTNFEDLKKEKLKLLALEPAE
ncbi:MAG TPA: penicillin acylase family protein [Ignavibacteria bacterium]|nr:penicillin acylase family protein [Ignavibacteria bacterium]